MNTLRFVYLTDTHIGCDTTGYRLQPRYLGQDVALFEGLAKWLKNHDVAFVVHGGDMTDHGRPREIERAGELCALLDVPVYLCLGNHDLAQRDSMRDWREVGGAFVPEGRDCFAVDAGPVRLVVVDHHWHSDCDHHWHVDQPQHPRLDARQQQMVRALIGEDSRPVIAVTHAPLNGVPAKQRCIDELFHPPHTPYLTTWQRIGADHANLRLALCGHNHAHSTHDHGPFVSCTTGAFGEMPAQLRLITVTPEAIEIATIGLAQTLGLPVDLDPANAWCVGDASDHNHVIPL